MPRTQNPDPGFPDPTPTKSEIPREFPIWFQKRSLKKSLEVQDPRHPPSGEISKMQGWGVTPQPKLMPDLDTFPSTIMPKKIVPGLPEPSGEDFKGFRQNNNVTKLPKLAWIGSRIEITGSYLVWWELRAPLAFPDHFWTKNGPQNFKNC